MTILHFIGFFGLIIVASAAVVFAFAPDDIDDWEDDDSWEA